MKLRRPSKVVTPLSGAGLERSRGSGCHGPLCDEWDDSQPVAVTLPSQSRRPSLSAKGAPSLPRHCASVPSGADERARLTHGSCPAAGVGMTGDVWRKGVP
jgi:hypothetical protein